MSCLSLAIECKNISNHKLTCNTDGLVLGIQCVKVMQKLNYILISSRVCMLASGLGL